MITLENVEALEPGDILQHVSLKNSDGTPVHAKVTGKSQIWRNRSYDFKIPVKYDLYQFFFITREEEEDWIIQKAKHMKITRETAETLRKGQILHHTTALNADKTPVRARVNGKVKFWKTFPDKFRIPMKYGLKTYFYITELNAHDWIIPEE